MYNKKLIIDSLKNLSKPSRMTNKNTFDLKESGSKKEDFVSAQEGVETPIYKAVKTGASPIEGKGLFAEQSIRKGDVIGVSHIRKKFMKNGEEYEAPFPSTVLGYYNHSEEPNVYEVDKGDYILMVAGRDIQRGHEITSDYTKHNIGDLEVPDDFKKGGSIKRPSLPNRKSPRSYSRSFQATNKLFAQNPLFAKSKSRKNKIFDPRAQYYDNGGESREPCPDGYAFNPKTGECIEWNPTVWESNDEPTSYDPVGDIVYMNPNDRSPDMTDDQYKQFYNSELEHEQLHRLQWVNGELKGRTGTPLRMPSTVDNQNYDGDHYYNRRSEEENDLGNYWMNTHPNEAPFIPGDMLYNKEINPALYDTPGMSEWEARDYEYATGDGMPSLFPKRQYGGASEQKIIFSPMEGGCPEGQYWTGTECKIIPKNTKIVYSEEELAKSNLSKKEQQKLYSQYISRTNNHNAFEAARLKKYGTISAKPKYYKTFESIPKSGWDPWMSYGAGTLIENGFDVGIPAIDEPMVPFSQWKKMMDKSSVKPIGFKGHPGGGHFYPIYEKPSNYLLGYNKEEPVIPTTRTVYIDCPPGSVANGQKTDVTTHDPDSPGNYLRTITTGCDPIKEKEIIIPIKEPVINTEEVPMGVQGYPEELGGPNWEWDRKYHSFTTPRLNKHFPLGPLFNGKKKHNFSTPYLHRRKDYKEGGLHKFVEEGEPDNGIITQEEIDTANTAMMKARLAYANEFGNPAAKRMINIPDETYEFTGDEPGAGVPAGNIGTHFMSSMDNYAVPFIQQGPNGLYYNQNAGPEDKGAMKFDSPEDADYFAEHYKDVSPGFLNQKQYGGLHKFVGGGGNPTCEKPYVWNPETNRCEKKSGCPDDFTFDPKSGRCVSNSNMDPRTLKYSNLWPKDLNLEDVTNPVYFPEVQQRLRVSHPDYKNKFSNSITEINQYPDLNYKVVVDPSKPEGFNKNENIYYVKSENTHQARKYKEWEQLKAYEKQNIQKLTDAGFYIERNPDGSKMKEEEGVDPTTMRSKPDSEYYTPGEDITTIDEDGNENITLGGRNYKEGMTHEKYINDQKRPQEFYNDPEYLGHVPQNVSYEDFYKKRPGTVKESYNYRCKDCSYGHGERYKIGDDYLYRTTNLSSENIYADPSIESMYPQLEFEEGADRPSYSPTDYDMIMPTIGIGPGETKSKLNRGRLMNGKGQNYKHTTYRQTKDLDFGTREATRPIPRMVQKATGYDRKFMEGYEDDEGNYFPGEIEKAEEEGRQINFKGASSLKDRKQQKIYNEKWKNSEEENKLIRQQNEDLLKEYGLNREEYVKLYGDFKNGGISLQLTKDDIQKYVDGGYVVEDLPKARFGKISKTVKKIARSNYNPLSIPIKKIGYNIASQSAGFDRSKQDILNALKGKSKSAYFGTILGLNEKGISTYGPGKRDLIANYFRENETGFEPIDYDIKSDSGLFAAIEEYGPLKVFAMNSEIQHGEPISPFLLHTADVLRDKEINSGTGTYEPLLNFKFPMIQGWGPEATPQFYLPDGRINPDFLLHEYLRNADTAKIMESVNHPDLQQQAGYLKDFARARFNTLFDESGTDVIPFDVQAAATARPEFMFESNPVRPLDNVAGHMAFLKRLPNKEFELTSRDLWGFTPSYDEKWSMNTAFQKAQRKAMEMFGKPFVLTQTNPIKFKQGGESNYELVEEIEDGGDPDPLDPHQAFLKNWYENRVFPKEMQKAKPMLLNQLEQPFPPYVPTDALPTNVAAAYNYDDNIVELNKNYSAELQESSKTHENNHYLTQDANEYLDKPHTNLIEQNIINPKDINTGNKEWDKAYKENFDEIVSPEEMHSRIMTLRELAGFKPDQVITEQDVEDYFESVGDKLDPDIQDIKQVTKGNKAIVELLNYMASNNSNEDLNVAKYGGTTDYQLGDPVDKATMERLKKLGYTFEII
jgi:hypothetical protein